METQLKHFGVLGMKWGHHKAKSTSNRPPVTAKGLAGAAGYVGRYALAGLAGHTIFGAGGGYLGGVLMGVGETTIRAIMKNKKNAKDAKKGINKALDDIQSRGTKNRGKNTKISDVSDFWKAYAKAVDSGQSQAQIQRQMAERGFVIR